MSRRGRVGAAALIVAALAMVLVIVAVAMDREPTPTATVAEERTTTLDAGSYLATEEPDLEDVFVALTSN